MSIEALVKEKSMFKKTDSRCFLVVVSVLGILSSTAEANRFAKIGQIRCADEKVPESECRTARKEMLRAGEITQVEYDYLTAREATPLFDVFGKVAGYCACGCFAPFLNILVSGQNSDEEKWMKIGDVLKEEQPFQVWSLDDNATLSNWTRVKRGIVTQTTGPENKPMVVIQTKSGRELVLTDSHAVLTSTGQMLKAKDVVPGHWLVSYLGESDEVENVDRRTISEDVINLLTDGKTALSHIVFVEGLAVGEIAWQNSLQSEISSVTVRQ
jgi:hypothetical protein